MKKEANRIKSLFVAYILTLVFNFLSAIGFLTGMSQKDLSDKYHNFLTPSSQAFSIWSVIYGLLFLLLIIYYFKWSYKIKEEIDLIYPFLMGTFIFNILWTILFTNDLIGLSTIAIIIYALLLLVISHYLGKLDDGLSLSKFTFGIYTGWLIIASLVNIAAFFKKTQFGVQAPNALVSGLVLIVISALAIFLVRKDKNPFILLAISWAAYFIYTANHNNSASPEQMIMAVIAIAASVILALVFIYQSYQIIKKP